MDSLDTLLMTLLSFRLISRCSLYSLMIVEFMWTFHNQSPSFIVIGFQDVCEEMVKPLVVLTSWKREQDTVKVIRDVVEMIMIWFLNMIATNEEIDIVLTADTDHMMTDIVLLMTDTDHMMTDTDHMMIEGEEMIEGIVVEIDTIIVDHHQGHVPLHEDDKCLLLLISCIWVYFMDYDGADLQVYKVVLLDIHNFVDDHLSGEQRQCIRKWVVVVQAQ